MHPEVKYIGFLTLPFAGTTSIFSFKYSILYVIINDIVKKLKRWSKSAGNRFISLYNTIFIKNKKLYYRCKSETSETLRNETVMIAENIKPISEHVSTHLKPINDEQFGHYLAGLIEGGGHFLSLDSSKQQLVIVFNLLDVSLAYYIKERLGYGSVHKVKNKNAVILVVTARKGIEKVIDLINGKIRTEIIYNQIKINILNNEKYIEYNNKITLNLNIDKNHFVENHWLAGFSDANASFQIKVLNCKKNKTEIRLNFQIDQKNNNNVILLIKNFLGGNIGYRKLGSQKKGETYYYGSTSFGSAKKVINYFDHFHLLSTKHINYLKWRKAYLIIQNKKHLTKEGIEKIIKLKNSMNRLNFLI